MGRLIFSFFSSLLLWLSHFSLLFSIHQMLQQFQKLPLLKAIKTSGFEYLMSFPDKRGCCALLPEIPAFPTALMPSPGGNPVKKQSCTGGVEGHAERRWERRSCDHLCALLC